MPILGMFLDVLSLGRARPLVHDLEMSSLMYCMPAAFDSLTLCLFNWANTSYPR